LAVTQGLITKQAFIVDIIVIVLEDTVVKEDFAKIIKEEVVVSIVKEEVVDIIVKKGIVNIVKAVITMEDIIMINEQMSVIVKVSCYIVEHLDEIPLQIEQFLHIYLYN